MKQPNYIVMPVYDCHHLTRDAIASCLAQDIVGGVQVLCVIDRGLDGVAHWLRSRGKRVQVVEAPGCGVSKAWNIALGHIFEELMLPAALVVNSDVRLRPDTYRRLFDDGGQFVTCVGTSSGAKFPGGEPSGKKRPHPDFSCFAIRRECWERVGRFDERLKIYVSDLDYHIRMHKAGIEAYCIDLPFFHYASGTLKNAEPDDRERILKQAQLDRDTFAAKWGVRAGSPEYYAIFSHPAPESPRADACDTNDTTKSDYPEHCPMD